MFEQEYKAAFSRVAMPDNAREEIMALPRKHVLRRKKYRSRLLLAAAIVAGAMALLGAYSGFVLYERPQEMLEALMGINGRSSYGSYENVVLSPEGYPLRIENPSGNRTELDIDLARKWLAPYIYQVGERITDGQTVLTAEACLIDRATKTGALYLKLENSPKYDVSSKGQVWWLSEQEEFYYYPDISMIGQDTFFSSYFLAEDMTTEDTLAVVYLFTCGEESRGMILSAGDSKESITIPFPDETGMQYLEIGDGEIILSPFGALLDSGRLGIRFWTSDIVSIVYQSGEEYLLHWEDPAWKKYETEPVQGQKIPYDEERQQTWENLKDPVYNSNFSVFLDEENTQLVYIFNRVLDLDEVKSVVINGIEYPAE